MIAGQGSAYFEASDPTIASFGGWGKLLADPSIVVQVLFRRNTGQTYYEGAVPANSGAADFTFPFDATTFADARLPFYTGFAIANMDAAQMATITCTVRDSNGNLIPTAVTVPQLAPYGHWADYLFPALNGLQGTIDCTSSTSVAATALRFIGADAFSTLQVTSK